MNVSKCNDAYKVATRRGWKGHAIGTYRIVAPLRVSTVFSTVSGYSDTFV